MQEDIGRRSSFGRRIILFLEDQIISDNMNQFFMGGNPAQIAIGVEIETSRIYGYFNKPKSNEEHPTMKPVDLIEHAILNSSKPGDIVFDPFGGIGSTLIACENLRRRARIIELDPKYVDIIVRRWQQCTGKQAIHAETRKGFGE